MKVWITKHALTEGIFTLEVAEPKKDTPGMVNGPGTFEHYHGEGREWHRTWESALEKAETMRVAKLKSLEKSAKKVRELKFMEPKP